MFRRIEEIVSHKLIAVVIYMLLFTFLVAKVNYYQYFVGNFPDESSHVAYVYYLEETNEIVPDFFNIPHKITYSSETGYSYATVSDYGTNYLGHPPLYYHIMRLCNGIKITDSTVQVNIQLLRDFSQLIAFGGILLCFYIGYSRIKKSILHVVYGTIIISVPMLAYGIAGVNNDSLAFLGMGLFMLALIRLVEKRRNIITYILLALGMLVIMLTKLTAGLAIALTCIVFFGFVFVKEKSVSIVLNRNFLFTVPIYLLIFMYYIYLIFTTGMIQPILEKLDYEFYLTSVFYVPVEKRVTMTIFEYCQYYWEKFFGTWTGIASHVSLLKNESVLSINRIGLFIIPFLPLISFYGKKENSIGKIPCQSIYLGVILTAIAQFLRAMNNFYNVTGYMGAYQSRYYLFALPALAYLICQALDERIAIWTDLIEKKQSSNRLGNILISFVLIMYCALLIYEDFVYFVFNFNAYL